MGSFSPSDALKNQEMLSKAILGLLLIFSFLFGPKVNGIFSKQFGKKKTIII